MWLSSLMGVGNGYRDLLGHGVWLESEYDINVTINGGNVVGIYDGNIFSWCLYFIMHQWI